MRMRSNTIYAESFEEFITLSNKADAIRETSIKSRRVIQMHIEVDDEEELGANNDYVAKKPLAFIEAEEEKELVEQISQMNISYHKSNKDVLDDSFQYEISSTIESASLIKEDQDKALFLSQNIAVASHTLKYLIIGDTKTGKTTLINSFLNTATDSYSPTENFEIKKTIYNYTRGEKVKLEFWDTSKQIIDSKLIQTYMKIANGFIFICDIADRLSIRFLKDKIQKVLNASSSKNYNNMFFYLNISSLSNEINEEDIKTNMDLFTFITDHYHIGTKRINALNLKKYFPNRDALFQEFIRNCIKGLEQII